MWCINFDIGIVVPNHTGTLIKDTQIYLNNICHSALSGSDKAFFKTASVFIIPRTTFAAFACEY